MGVIDGNIGAAENEISNASKEEFAIYLQRDVTRWCLADNQSFPSLGALADNVRGVPVLLPSVYLDIKHSAGCTSCFYIRLRMRIDSLAFRRGSCRYETTHWWL